MKTKIENKIRTMCGGIIADYTDRMLSKNNGVLTEANNEAIETAKKGQSELIAVSGKLHAIMHIDVTEKRLAEFSKLGGDIKAVHRLADAVYARLGLRGYRGSSRLVLPMLEWSLESGKAIPLNNGSFGKLFETEKSNFFSSIERYTPLFATDYRQPHKGKPKFTDVLSTILRQNGTAKEVLYLLGICDIDGVVQDNGVTRCFRKSIK